MPGIGSLPLSDTPVSVIDFETTGLYPKRDRVVEVTVVRYEPGHGPELVFDTLVNPARKVGATDIHGITDEDVKDAPAFDEIAGDVLEAVKGSVLSAYNVYFDMKFLAAELSRMGVEFDAPHFCLMYMRPLLGLGKKGSLAEICEEVGVPLLGSHTAAEDAMAAAELWSIYLEQCASQRVETFGDLSRMSTYKFLQSFVHDAPAGPERFNLAPSRKSFSRRSHAAELPLSDEQLAIREYWDIIKEVVADLQVTDDEAELAVATRKELGLSKEQIRYLHARAFAAAINQFIDDQFLDDTEVRKLRKLHVALSRMGWAPGE